MKKGFTLVELSIVIVIIGFLVAGIAAGTNLVRQAELRKIITSVEQYSRNYTEFQGTYNAVPGDLNVASAYWSNCASGGIGNANCNGDGDGYIIWNMGVAGSGWNADQSGDETIKAFRHLNLAGINLNGGSTVLPSSFSPTTNGTGLGNTSDGYYPSIGAKNATLTFVTVSGGTTGNTTAIAGRSFVCSGTLEDTETSFPPLTTTLVVLKENTCRDGALTAEEAFNLDAKFDDGVFVGTDATGADSGKIRAMDHIQFSGGPCLSGNNYDIGETEPNCFFEYKIAD